MERGEMGAGPGREEGHTAPEAPPLGRRRELVPSTSLGTETTEGAVIAPRCLQGVWAKGKAALKFPPRQPLSPGGASPGGSQLTQRALKPRL